jgi:hypothetical protein
MTPETIVVWNGITTRAKIVQMVVGKNAEMRLATFEEKRRYLNQK